MTGILDPWQSDFALAASACVIIVTWLVTDRIILTLGQQNPGFWWATKMWQVGLFLEYVLFFL